MFEAAELQPGSTQHISTVGLHHHRLEIVCVRPRALHLDGCGMRAPAPPFLR